jgi:uncharacterized protein DUF6152
MTRLILTVALLALPVAGVVSAHHSFPAHYFEDQSVTIKGEVAEFAYRSPHSWVYVMAPDEKGQLQRFGAEWAGTERLARMGITRDTLKAGDQVIITGSPGRNPADRALHLKAIDRPADGWSWRPAPRTP